MDLAAIQSQFLPSILCVIIFIPFTFTCTVNTEHIATIIASNTEQLFFRAIKDKKRNKFYFTLFIYPISTILHFSRKHPEMYNYWIVQQLQGFPSGSTVKNPPVNAEDTGSTPGLGRSPGEGNGNPIQYSCQDNTMDRGAWQATVHGVTKSKT